MSEEIKKTRLSEDELEGIAGGMGYIPLYCPKDGSRLLAERVEDHANHIEAMFRCPTCGERYEVSESKS